MVAKSLQKAAHPLTGQAADEVLLLMVSYLFTSYSQPARTGPPERLKHPF
jgi:hypothetical protein